MKNNDACFSHNTDDWRTPSDLYNSFINSGFIDTFPFQANYNELDNVYFNKKLFVNPPFSKFKLGVCDWIIKQILNNNKIVLLLPSRTDTIYFHRLLEFAPHIIFIQGRLKFNDIGCAPFPTMLLCFNLYNNDYYHSYSYEFFSYEDLLNVVSFWGLL